MFLKYFTFKKLPYTSAASRHVFFYKMKELIIWKPRALSLRKKNYSGRNDSGKITFRSRTSTLKRLKNIQINYKFRYVKPSFVSHFQFLPFKNKIISLVFFANGLITFFLTTTRHRLFYLFYASSNERLTKIFSINITKILIKIKNKSIVNSIEMLYGHGGQYCRSTGSTSKIIKFDLKTHSTLIRLPSGNIKAFPCFNYAALGRVGYKENRKFLNSKAGYWRTFGCKSIVRGVAKNPVDHPHGGRTKSIRYPKTPWGKTTKFK